MTSESLFTARVVGGDDLDQTAVDETAVEVRRFLTELAATAPESGAKSGLELLDRHDDLLRRCPAATIHERTSTGLLVGAAIAGLVGSGEAVVTVVCAWAESEDSARQGVEALGLGDLWGVEDRCVVNGSVPEGFEPFEPAVA